MIRCSETDERLLSRCISGDRRASELFIRRFSGLVYGYVRNTFIAKQVSCSEQDLEDLHNSIFLELFDQKCKKLKQYKGKNGCSIASWIRLVAIRYALNHLRKKGVDAIGWQKKKMPLEDLPELESHEMEALVVMEEKEKEHLIQNGIENLPPRDCLFMKLYIEKELSIKEIAETMNLSIQSVYTVKHRAIERLKSQINSVLNA